MLCNRIKLETIQISNKEKGKIKFIYTNICIHTHKLHTHIIHIMLLFDIFINKTFKHLVLSSFSHLSLLLLFLPFIKEYARWFHIFLVIIKSAIMYNYDLIVGEYKAVL